MEFFLVNFRPTNYSLQPGVYVKFQKILETVCTVEFLFSYISSGVQVLHRIAALSSFLKSS